MSLTAVLPDNFGQRHGQASASVRESFEIIIATNLKTELFEVSDDTAKAVRAAK